MNEANADIQLGSRNQQLKISFDKEYGVLWSTMTQKNRIPCFNSDLISEIASHQQEIEKSQGIIRLGNEAHKIKYSVASSDTNGVFSLGGDLALIKEMANNNMEGALTDYAIRGTEALLQRIFHFNTPDITTISLLQGQTLGSGLEVALTSDVIIAEKNTLMGFPEVLFNSFPGMGGYSLTARKIGTKLADKMLIKGKIYTAQEGYDMGLVDVLAEVGEGTNAVYNWIESNRRHANSFLAIQKAKKRFNPITRDEVMDIVYIWIDTILKLSDRDLSIMERFIRQQQAQYLINRPILMPSPATKAAT
jgi:DSF synthase